eukprot:366474-Chlamydomonas_euryale.AAC.13
MPTPALRAPHHRVSRPCQQLQPRPLRPRAAGALRQLSPSRRARRLTPGRAATCSCARGGCAGGQGAASRRPPPASHAPASPTPAAPVQAPPCGCRLPARSTQRGWFAKTETVGWPGEAVLGWDWEAKRGV